MPRERSEILDFLGTYSLSDKFQPKNGEHQALNGKTLISVMKLLRDEDCSFLSIYGIEIYNDMVRSEDKSQFASLLTR